MEEADAHAVPAEHLDETDLSLVKLPTRSDEAAVLIGIGIGEHDLLFSALRNRPACDIPEIDRRRSITPTQARKSWIVSKRGASASNVVPAAASMRPTSFIKSASSSMSDTSCQCSK